jgi:hypothetical protein
MPRCLKCGEGLSRTHRNLLEKVVYNLVFQCRACGARVGERRHFLNYFVKHTRCPRCGTDEVEKRKSVDKIDKRLKTPMSLLQAGLGGSLYHCVFCRIQFYDVRSRARNSPRSARNAESRADDRTPA